MEVSQPFRLPNPCRVTYGIRSTATLIFPNASLDDHGSFTDGIHRACKWGVAVAETTNWANRETRNTLESMMKGERMARIARGRKPFELDIVWLCSQEEETTESGLETDASG